MYEFFDPAKKYHKAFATDEDVRIAKAIREYVDKEVMPLRQDLEGGFYRDEKLAKQTIEKVAKGFAKIGVHKLAFPKEVGGLGILSAVTFNITLMEMCRADIALTIDLLIPAWVALPAVMVNNEVVMKKFFPRFCGDEPRRACFAITEPQGGCNVEDPAVYDIRTTAKLEGDEWVINGHKIWPSGAGVADLYLVVCTTDPKLGEEGIALIYVPPDADGLSFGKPEKKMGMIYTDVNAEIFFDNVRVPKEYRAAGPGVDAMLFKSCRSFALLATASMGCGAAEAALEIILDWTSKREIKGKPVRERSMHAGMIADMLIALEHARAYALQTAWMFDNPGIFGTWDSHSIMARAAAARVFSADMAVMVTNKAMELMGSYGYAYENNLEKYLRDVKEIQLWLGGQQLSRLEVARGLYHFHPW